MPVSVKASMKMCATPSKVTSSDHSYIIFAPPFTIHLLPSLSLPEVSQ